LAIAHGIVALGLTYLRGLKVSELEDEKHP